MFHKVYQQKIFRHEFDFWTCVELKLNFIFLVFSSLFSDYYRKLSSPNESFIGSDAIFLFHSRNCRSIVIHTDNLLTIDSMNKHSVLFGCLAHSLSISNLNICVALIALLSSKVFFFF